MKIPPTVATGVLVVGSVLTLSGCQATNVTCSAGLSALFDLTVSSTHGDEPSVQYCAVGHCTPRPITGAIPRVQRDTTDEHAATVTHVGRGEWQINPRSNGTTPETAEIRLYRDGVLDATRTVHLTWPSQDPCAASNPPNPHPTIRS